ncbi:MAG: M48 family metalloprotease [Ignavibacteriales bacterium]|nr:M48 family metalloprotease [Ignavibacteriales bacterium]
MLNKKFVLNLFTIVVCLLLFVRCGSSIESINYSEIEDYNHLPEDDKDLWFKSDHENSVLKKSGLVYNDQDLREYINEIGFKLIPDELKKSIVPFKFEVIYDPELNAFALPNGTIYIHLGMLAKLEDESQLAFILAHELVHVIKRHTAHAFSTISNTSAMLQIFSVATVLGFSTMQSNWAGFWNSLAQTGLVLSAYASVNGFGRTMEKEADITALKYMLDNYYDLNGAVRVMEILLEKYDDPSAIVVFFYGNHPLLKERIEYLKNEINKMNNQYSLPDTLIKNKEKYISSTNFLKEKIIELWIRNGKYRDALEDSKKYSEMFPENPEIKYWTGEAIRLSTDNPDSIQIAEDLYLSAISLKFDYAEPNKGIALIYEERNDFEMAIEYYGKYVELAPNSSDRRYILNKIDELKEQIVK